MLLSFDSFSDLYREMSSFEQFESKLDNDFGKGVN